MGRAEVVDAAAPRRHSEHGRFDGLGGVRQRASAASETIEALAEGGIEPLDVRLLIIPPRWEQYRPEFIAHAVQHWLRQTACKTIYITPGSPGENPLIESFFATLRRECLDRYPFCNGSEAQTILEEWRHEYNCYRPHSALDYMTPSAYVNTISTIATPIPVPAAAVPG